MKTKFFVGIFPIPLVRSESFQLYTHSELDVDQNFRERVSLQTLFRSAWTLKPLS